MSTLDTDFSHLAKANMNTKDFLITRLNILNWHSNHLKHSQEKSIMRTLILTSNFYFKIQQKLYPHLLKIATVLNATDPEENLEKVLMDCYVLTKINTIETTNDPELVKLKNAVPNLEKLIRSVIFTKNALDSMLNKINALPPDYNITENIRDIHEQASIALKQPFFQSHRNYIMRVLNFILNCFGSSLTTPCEDTANDVLAIDIIQDTDLDKTFRL